MGCGAWLWLAATCPAQEKAAPTNPQISSKDQAEEVRPAPFPLEVKPDRKSDVTVGKKFRISGPLVALFKGKSIRQTPKRFLQLINPFQQRAEEAAPEWTGGSDLNPRAWSSLVGWRPGASAFPDPATHEGGITVVGFSR